jgi:DNA-directed RNA polymerase alpha subunit
MTTQAPMLPVNVQRDEDAAFSEAWRRVEAALPDGAWFDLSRYTSDRSRAVAYLGTGYDNLTLSSPSFSKATPTEALTALAEALEQRA